jgi:hypothetical protein
LSDGASRRVKVGARLTALALVVLAVPELFEHKTIGDLERDGFQVSCGNAFSDAKNWLCGIHQTLSILVALVLVLVACLVLVADAWRRRRRRRRHRGSYRPAPAGAVVEPG